MEVGIVFEESPNALKVMGFKEGEVYTWPGIKFFQKSVVFTLRGEVKEGVLYIRDYRGQQCPVDQSSMLFNILMATPWERFSNASF